MKISKVTLGLASCGLLLLLTACEKHQPSSPETGIYFADIRDKSIAQLTQESHVSCASFSPAFCSGTRGHALCDA